MDSYLESIINQAAAVHKLKSNAFNIQFVIVLLNSTTINIRLDKDILILKSEDFHTLYSSDNPDELFIEWLNIMGA